MNSPQSPHTQGGRHRRPPLFLAPGTRFAPLEQINASNFNKLEVAWRLKTDHFGPIPEYKLEGTPLMVKGVLYTTAGTRRAVVALNAETGETKWSFDTVKSPDLWGNAAVGVACAKAAPEARSVSRATSHARAPTNSKRWS